MSIRLTLLFILLFHWVRPSSGFGQTTLSLNLGLGRTAIRDGTVSPLTFASGSPNLQLQYERLKTRSIQQVVLWYEPSNLSNRFGNSVSMKRGSLAYRYGRRLGTGPFYAGGEAEAYGAYRAFMFSSIYFAQNLSADLHATVNATAWYIGPLKPWGRLSLALNTPVIGVGFVQRLYNLGNYPASLEPDGQSSITAKVLNNNTLLTPRQLFNVYGRGQYERPLGKRTSFLLGAGFRWYRYERLFNTTRLSQFYVSAGLSYQLY